MKVEKGVLSNKKKLFKFAVQIISEWFVYLKEWDCFCNMLYYMVDQVLKNFTNLELELWVEN